MRTGDRSEGEVYALIDQSYDTLGPALQRSEHWCNIVILHLNVKQCRPSPHGERLSVAIGRKYDQPLAHAYSVQFSYRVGAASTEYLHVVLNADRGPFGTRGYRLAVEATPIARARTFVHLSYSYEYGMTARLALEAYLHTLGREKVGFTVVSRSSGGYPIFVTGLRGLVERNAMRYFLAIEVYARSLAAPPQERLEKRLRDWYAETERYAPQLHELERDEYLAMKRREIARQASGG